MKSPPVEEIFVRRSLISCFRLMNHEIMTLTQVKKKSGILLSLFYCLPDFVVVFVFSYILELFLVYLHVQL